MGYCLNGVNTEGIPMYLIEEFLNEISIPVLVELGSAGGKSAKEAAKHFHKVITIELNDGRQLQEDSPTNIEWLSGNTIDVLPELMNDFINKKPSDDHRYVMFFVDSHFDGDKPEDSPYKDCYLLEELDIISQYSQDAIVIIDDARLFLGYPPHPNNPKQWPTIAEIFLKFKDKFPYHFTTVVDDYIISFPDRLEWIYQREWMARYKIRYPDEPEVIKNATKLAYNSLLKYIQ